MVWSGSECSWPQMALGFHFRLGTAFRRSGSGPTLTLDSPPRARSHANRGESNQTVNEHTQVTTLRTKRPRPCNQASHANCSSLEVDDVGGGRTPSLVQVTITLSKSCALSAARSGFGLLVMLHHCAAAFTGYSRVLRGRGKRRDTRQQRLSSAVMYRLRYELYGSRLVCPELERETMTSNG